MFALLAGKGQVLLWALMPLAARFSICMASGGWEGSEGEWPGRDMAWQSPLLLLAHDCLYI
jgi:hypothetical protein